MGGFYLLGEGVPPDKIDPIHDMLIDYCRTHYTPSRLNLNYIDIRYRRYFWNKHRDRDELMMHVPLAVRPSDALGERR